MIFSSVLFLSTAVLTGPPAGSNSVTIPRETFFTNTTEIYTGISEKSRVNIGYIFQIRSNTFGGADALNVFKFEDNASARSGLTTIAPSIRVQPFAGIHNFSFTSSVYLPFFKYNSKKKDILPVFIIF